MSKLNNHLDKDEIHKKVESIDNQEDDDVEQEFQDNEQDDERNKSDEQEDDAESLDSEEENDEVRDEEKKPQIDYKEKFKQSTREAQILLSKNRKLTETIDQAAMLTEPTEQELAQYATSEGLNYSELTTTEKIMLKKSYIADKRFDMVNEAVQEAKKVDEWAAKVDELLEKNETSSKYPQLVGRENEFKAFAMKPSRRGVDLEDLIKAFSFDLKPVKKKGSLFATATGGEKEQVKTILNDADEVARIRRTDPRRYREMIKSKKIKIDY